MTARTDLMVEALDDLCEHPFLVRVLELGMVGLNFETKGDVASFQDAWYVLSVEARAEILRRQIRSLQRLVLLLEKSQSIDNIAFNIDEFLAIVSDAAQARTTSIADLCLILTREVFEIAVEDIETSFGRLRKHINQPELFSVLGRLTDPKRAWKIRRNERFHSGFRHGTDENDAAFEFGSSWRERGQSIALHKTNGEEVSLQELFDTRRNTLMAEFLDEIEFIRKQVITLCEILEPIFEDSFSQKVALPSSYMKLTRSAKD